VEINISFPEIGSRMQWSDKVEDGDVIGGMQFIKKISSKIKVSKLNGVHPSVELVTHYTEDFDPSVSFSEFEARASEHIKNILSGLNVPA